MIQMFSTLQRWKRHQTEVEVNLEIIHQDLNALSY